MSPLRTDIRREADGLLSDDLSDQTSGIDLALANNVGWFRRNTQYLVVGVSIPVLLAACPPPKDPGEESSASSDSDSDVSNTINASSGAVATTSDTSANTSIMPNTSASETITSDVTVTGNMSTDSGDTIDPVTSTTKPDPETSSDTGGEPNCVEDEQGGACIEGECVNETECECFDNITGKNCDKCAKGFVNFPDCIPNPRACGQLTFTSGDFIFNGTVVEGDVGTPFNTAKVFAKILCGIDDPNNPVPEFQCESYIPMNPSWECPVKVDLKGMAFANCEVTVNCQTEDGTDGIETSKFFEIVPTLKLNFLEKLRKLGIILDL